VYADGVLGLAAGLSREWARWLKAHGLAHHLLHRGDHAYARAGLYLCQQQELEAELFAGTLVLGAVSSPAGLPALAAAARVPLACVHSWPAALALAHEPDRRRFRGHRARAPRRPSG
jgi:hypothetical protein